MTAVEWARMKACGKVALGAAKMVSGVVTATGHGLVGTYCRNHRAIQAAIALGVYSLASGTEMIEHGIAEFKDASNGKLCH
jgi:hypothetical protein